MVFRSIVIIKTIFLRFITSVVISIKIQVNKKNMIDVAN